MRRLILILWCLTVASHGFAVTLGKPAPAFDLHTLTGENTSLKAYRGRVVFVHFWASWCVPCKEEFPKLNELAATYPDDEFAVLAITVDKAQANIDRFLAKYVKPPLKAKVLRDPEGRVAEQYQNRAMPITFVVDIDGVIRYMHMGFQKGDEARWRAEVDELLKERE